MVEKKSWTEFREAGMLYVTNLILQCFGWSLVYEKDGDEIKTYPVITKYRGFSTKANEEGHAKVGKYCREHSAEIFNEKLYE